MSYFISHFGETATGKIWMRYDSVSGANLGSRGYPGWLTATSIKIMPDRNANGIEEVMALGATTIGANLWIAHDGSTGTQLDLSGYAGWFSPSKIQAVTDQTSDGISEVVTLGQTTAGYWLWQLRNGNTDALIRQVSLPGWSTPSTVVSVNDLDTNGVDEIATYGTSSGGVNLWQIHDMSTSVLTNTVTLQTDFIPVIGF